MVENRTDDNMLAVNSVHGEATPLNLSDAERAYGRKMSRALWRAYKKARKPFSVETHGADVQWAFNWLAEGLVHNPVPSYMIDSLVFYVADGSVVGGFLTAVLSNDLAKSFHKADAENLEALHNWVNLVDGYIPTDARGSTEKVKKWKGYPDCMMASVEVKGGRR